MLSLRNKNTISVVEDQIGCPTYAQDLAQGVKIIIKNINDNKHFNNWGIYNFCGKYECSWFRFAEMIFFIANKCGIETPKELLQISSKKALIQKQKDLNIQYYLIKRYLMFLI